MARIHIRQVLALMDTYEVDTKPIEFSLSFITKSGEWRHLKRAAKGFKSSRTAKGQSNFGYNLKEKGIVLIHDLDYIDPKTKEKGRVISVVIEGIRFFNSIEVCF